MRRTVTGKKKRGGKKFLLFLIFAIGAGAGWYLKDETRRQEALKASEDIPGLIDKAGKNLPGLLEKGKESVSNFDIGSLTSMFSNIPLTLFRLYDAYVPADIRNTLSEGMPDFFAYPYICRLERVFSPNDGRAIPGGVIGGEIGGEQLSLGQGTVIYPGAKLSAPGNLAFEVKCRGENITVGPGTTVQLLRGEGAAKFFRVDGVINVRTEGNRVVGFAFPWGELTLQTRGVGSMQLGSKSNPPALNIYDGQIDMLWQVTSTKAAGYANLKVVAGSNAKLRITRRYGSDEEARNIAPRKEVFFLASGRFSGSKGVDPGQMAKPMGGAGSTETIDIEKKLLVAKTPWFELQNTVDLTINWRLYPVNRLVPCKVELSVDPQMGSLLATYQSAKMSLFLKGIQPAVYYWRARCEASGSEIVSPITKIQVIDGKKSPPVPVLTAPGDGQQAGSPVEFRWQDIEGAKAYVLQLSRFKDFRSGKPYNAKSPGLNMNLKKKGTYYWRVFGVGGVKKLRTAVSPVRSFKF